MRKKRDRRVVPAEGDGVAAQMVALDNDPWGDLMSALDGLPESAGKQAALRLAEKLREDCGPRQAEGIPVVAGRHAEVLPDLLRDRGLVDGACAVTPMPTIRSVAGRHVFGSIPVHLGFHAAMVTDIPIRIPHSRRSGQFKAGRHDLSIEEVREMAGKEEHFRVVRVG